MAEVAQKEEVKEEPKTAFRWEIVPPGIMKVELDLYRMKMAEALGWVELLKGDVINAFQAQKAANQAMAKKIIVPNGILGQAKSVLKKIIQ